MTRKIDSSRTVLVTGGAGFIGRSIVDAALEAGWSVRVVDSLRSDVHGDQLPLPDQVDFIHGDVTSLDEMRSALRGVDVVCHQAAKVGLGVDFSDAPDYVASNVLGTSVLLAAMTDQSVSRLVMASSMVVYGEGRYGGPRGVVQPPPRLVEDLEAGMFDPLDPQTGRALDPLFVREDAELDPRNVYAVTKLAQEQLANAWTIATGGSAAALRYHNVYGPGMPQNTPYAGVASLFRSALERGEAPRVYEDGGQRRDFVHVRDVADANVAAMAWTEDQRRTFRAFNVGSGTVHTVGDLADRLSRYTGGPAPVTTGQYRLGDVRHITASSDRIRAELNWTASVDFEDGMREFATAPLRAAVV